jgi:hypothetical protein
MFDGGACDTCFICGLLEPSDETCGRCGGRMAYRPATMMDDAALETMLRERCAAYRASPSLARLVLLAEAIHRFAPASLSVLTRIGGPTVAELRSAYATRSA